MEDQHITGPKNGDDDEEQKRRESSSKRCSQQTETASLQTLSRKEKRKAKKKMKRKQVRREIAEKEKERENDPEEMKREEEREREERERCAREVREFEERERKWLEELEAKKRIEEEETLKKKILEEEQHKEIAKVAEEYSDDDNWEYVEEGPAEIIWQGNEIIVRKKKVRVPKKNADDANRPTSNPLPPQSEIFSDYMNVSSVPAQEALGNVAQQVPNFGTELDKAHCPFHLKTGACRFGQRCSRVHFYPDKSCTLLMKNMYNGPGLAWEQDEGLEYTDEEVEHSFEEFYEDVHTEFLKFGEIVNFKVCKNGSPHLRGNVYVHYKSLKSAVLAYQSFNGRYYAGKQLKCEFVNISRWKVAICGEYIKSRLQTCSHGTACNFIHCFRNPGGDYEWADWDKPAPRFWLRKMAALFGYSDSPEKLTDKNMGQGSSSAKKKTSETDRYHSRRSRSRELDSLNGNSRRRHSDERDDCNSSTHWRGQAADEEWLDRDRDGYCSHRKRSLKHRKEGNGFLDKNKIQEADSDKDRRHRHGERGAHHRRGRKRSEGHRKEYADEDDNENQTGRLSKDGDIYRHDNHNRRNSRHQSESRYQDEVEGKMGSRCHSAGGQSELDGERDKDGHYTGRRKTSKSRDKHYEFLDDNEGIRSTSESHSSDDQSEISMERHHQNSRKSSRNSDKLGRQDDHEDCKKREHDIDSPEQQSNEYSGRDRHHSHRRKISKQRNSPDIDYCEEQIDEYSVRDGHQSHKRRSSKHRRVVDSHHGSKRKALDIDTFYDWRDSDRDRDRERRHYSRKRKHSTHWDEDGALKKNKEAFGTQESDIEELSVEGSQNCVQPSISSSSIKNNKADLFVDSTELNKDQVSTYLGHNGERYASGYNDEDCDMGRWEPESPIELYH